MLAQQRPERKQGQQNGMMATWKTRWRISRPTVSQGLRSGMLAAALLALALMIAFRACAPAPEAKQRHINQPATAFTLPAEQHGVRMPAPITFAPAPGKATLLVFFYTLCAHCLLNVQTAHEVASEFPDLHSIYIDSPAEQPVASEMMMHRIAITDPVLLDSNGQVASRYGIAYYPALALIDRKGIVRAIWTGEFDAATLRAGMMRALAATVNG